MTAAGVIIAAGGAAMLTLLLWPTAGTRLSLRSTTSFRSLASLPAEIPIAVVVGVAVLVMGLTLGHAVASAICAVVPTSAVKVLVYSIRRVRVAEGVARFASVLSNQASVAVTVADAVSRAAPLVGGPVGAAATAMASDCEDVGVDIAAQRFAARVPSAVAGSLADLITISAAGGGRWAETVTVLEAEASQTAETARLFHGRVAMAMPTLVLVVLLSAGLVAGTSLVAGEVGTWLAGSQGAALLLAAAVVIAAMSARVLLPARAAARYGGLQ